MRPSSSIALQKLFRGGIGVGICMGLLAAIAIAQTTINITRYLQNEQNKDIIAFAVTGSFETDDVIMLYTNDTFIKAKAVSAEDAAKTGGLLVENISLDSFGYGVNKVVAKIERKGVVVAESAVFPLPIKPPPGKPETVTVAGPDSEDMYTVTVTGAFEAGDEVKVFLVGKDDAIRTETVTEEQAGARAARVAGIKKEELQVGENFFEAVIGRIDREGERSDRSNPVNIRAENEPLPDNQCLRYGEPEKLMPRSSRQGGSEQRLGRFVSATDGIIAAGTDTGFVRIYSPDGETWAPFDIRMSEEYWRGVSETNPIAVSGSGVIVGIPGSGERGHQSGAAHEYARAGGAWTRQAALAPERLVARDEFGAAIAASGARLVVSAKERDGRGAVYLYTRGEEGWGDPEVIKPSDEGAGKRFGESVAVSESRVVVGAPGDRGRGENAGAVYVFVKTGDEWEEKKITPEDVEKNDRFGSEVIIRDGYLFVGAPGDDDSGTNTGAAHVFTAEGEEWNREGKLTPTGDAVRRRGRFGSSLEYRNGILAVGMPAGGVRAGGVVYIYKKSGESWNLWGNIEPDESRPNDSFGESVALDGFDLVVGMPGSDKIGQNAGAIYRYGASIEPCPEMPVEEEVDKEAEERDRLALLEDRKKILEGLVESATGLLETLAKKLTREEEDAADTQERIVIFDETVASRDAQRRAAEIRGIVGPDLTGEVKVERVGERPEDPPPARSRNEVVRETRNDLGAVVPIAEKDLAVDAIDEEVYRLQVFLNERGYRIASQGPGSPGNETSRFTQETEQALRRFQLIHGIPVTGVLDRETRDSILTYIPNF